MGCRWLFSWARRTPARLPTSSIATLPRSTGSPASSCPTADEVERVERDLLTRVPALLGGWLGTFDGLSATDRAPLRERGPPDAAPAVARRPARGRRGRRSSSSALRPASRGFGDALGDALAELESALVEPEEVDGELGRLYRAYRAELERLGVVDRELLAGAGGRAAVGGDLDAWSGAPVFVYGFEDLTGAQWALLEALAGRCEVVVSLPYEPGRPAFAALERTANDLARLSHGRASRSCRLRTGTTPRRSAHLERVLFEDRDVEPPPLEGAVRFLEAAGRRARSSSSARRSSGCSATGVGRGRHRRSSCRPSSTCARRSRLPSVRSAFRTPWKERDGSRALRSAVRLLGVAALRLARRRAAGSLRVSALSVLGAPPFPGRLRRRAAYAGGRYRSRNGSRRRRCDCSADRLPLSNGSGRARRWRP